MQRSSKSVVMPNLAQCLEDGQCLIILDELSVRMIKIKITVRIITIWNHLMVTFKDVMTLLLDPKTFF